VLPRGDEATPIDYLDLLVQAVEEPVDPGGVSGTIDQVSETAEVGLVWGTGTTTHDDTVAASMVFADADGEWVFTLVAPSPSDRLGLLDAFCTATGT
jgi:hypothetical protein